ncbi:MAG: D-alanyl-D-alanine carboxypeptidase [Pigmentiphaga sp.]|nr:D-alanyl-D-alanine carboxypeptidase [Pigmentiphaga sp.]
MTFPAPRSVRRPLAVAVVSAFLLASPFAIAQTNEPTPVTASAGLPAALPSIGALSSVPAPTLAARAWISIDLTSGQILTEEKPEERIEPASLTKVMSAYLVFNALREKRLSLTQMVSVSEKAWRTGGSRMFIEPNKPVSIDELIRGMIVQSGNDATVALAEAVAGTEEAFAGLMNEEARRLGMTGSHFTNSSGLPDPQHITTVRDLGILAQRLIQDHPDFYSTYYKEKSYTYNKITQPNRNRLLWLDPSVDGMKTGHTDAAGYCLIASAMRGERRVLTVLVGAKNDTTRAQESLKLMNWGFQNFDAVKLYDANQVVTEPDVWKGSVDKAKLGAATPIWVTVPRGKAAEIKPQVERTDPLIAPLTQGQPVGTLHLTLDDQVIGSVPLITLEPVGKAGFFGRLFDAVRLWFK